jgi:hypothetical protein
VSQAPQALIASKALCDNGLNWFDMSAAQTKVSDSGVEAIRSPFLLWAGCRPEGDDLDDEQGPNSPTMKR